MSTIKTVATSASAEDYINAVEDEEKKKDSLVLLDIFTRITGEKPIMWGESIIGFGSYHYKSEKSKQEGDWPLIAFSPRKQNLTLYIMPGFASYADLLEDLGKYKTSVGCLYIRRLADVVLPTLEKIIAAAFTEMKQKNS